MTRKDLSDTLGLSCVEKYFLAWLKETYDVTKLYGSSFVSLYTILLNFIWGAQYETFTAIPRLQNIAEANGLVVHSYECLSVEDATELLAGQCAEELILIRTSPAFFEGFKRVPWRKDHYIYVDSTGKWLNEYPLAEGRFGKEELKRAYGGAVLKFRRTSRGRMPADENITAITNQLFKELPQIEFKDYEGALGILRITRKRLECCFADQDEVAKLLREEVLFLDKAYFEARRLLLRDAGSEENRNKIARARLLETERYEKRLKELFL